MGKHFRIALVFGALAYAAYADPNDSVSTAADRDALAEIVPASANKDEAGLAGSGAKRSGLSSSARQLLLYVSIFVIGILLHLCLMRPPPKARARHPGAPVNPPGQGHGRPPTPAA